MEAEFLYSDAAEGLASNVGQKDVVMGRIGRIVGVYEGNMIVDVVGFGVNDEEEYYDLPEGSIFAQARATVVIVLVGRRKDGQG